LARGNEKRPPARSSHLTKSNICFKQVIYMVHHRATLSVSGIPRSPRPRKVTTPTRAKLLEAAAQVFADRGYYHATIREICRRADANVAAVNYTFGDKLGLYTEVLRQVFRTSEMTLLTAELDSARSPEELLRKVIQARLRSLCGRSDLHFRIVMHEFSKPTPALARVVEGIRPAYERTGKALSMLLGLPSEHEKTRLCHNSIIGQILFYSIAQPMLARLQPDFKLTPEKLERVAEHIADFSLAYVRKNGET
jgi:TetR/AcrR family transcriptional regulator, regulator of cefoperazone and chloramphenicol sensitivity